VEPKRDLIHLCLSDCVTLAQVIAGLEYNLIELYSK
jgi:hypothetical protein